MKKRALGGDGNGPDGGARRRRPDMAFDPVAAALRQMHDKVANEAIPDDFNDLLDRLAARVEERKPS